jgi:hypothetical protein
MQDKTTQLYPNEQVSAAVSDYAFKHSTPLPTHIADLHAWGVANHEKSNYMISPSQAQFHIWMTKALGAKRGKFSPLSISVQLCGPGHLFIVYLIIVEVQSLRGSLCV